MLHRKSWSNYLKLNQITNLDKVHDGHRDDDDGRAEETEERDGDESDVRGESVTNQSVHHETH